MTVTHPAPPTRSPVLTLIEDPAKMHEVRRRLRGEIGLVPTMGYLHDGHLSLVRRARAENDVVITTIFVNPTQFGPGEDLDAYPRDLPRDLALLEQEGVDIVFAPAAEALYPPGYQTWVELSELPRHLEGARRPGHFRGVTTIVTKLFNLTRPTRAYFGQKDAQQALILRRLVEDLNYDLELVICPTMREASGLAMSSRNTYLTPEERRRAAVLYRALCAARDAYLAGERDARRLRRLMQDTLDAEPLAQTEYVSIADLATLEEVPAQIRGPVLASLAVRIGKARLIDNLWLGTSPEEWGKTRPGSQPVG
ncbi:MAG: pantoate--beta-alanine ligase [Caldilineae bacterium]|nr:MAG: pantoate--beta-alanine ligase [Caldilineae bacterium]